MNCKICALLCAATLVFSGQRAAACTNVLVTKGASATGSTMLSYSADSHTLYGEMYRWPAATWRSGTMLPVYNWETGKYSGEIPQASQTCSVMGYMNEHQLCIAETTFGSPKELIDTTGLMDYGSLIFIALQRAKTAREAIRVITDLVAEYGYCSEGETFSFIDPNEVWVMDLIGKGTKMVRGKNVNKGAVWVAMRIPDGCISAHANHPRITQISFNDPENCMYAPDAVSFARSQGYYKGSDKDFSFSDAYAPLDFSSMRACEARVWAVFNAFGEGMEQYVDYAMGHDARKRMPLYIKPNRKLSVKDVADIMRDHYEGTPMDMTADIGAGGEECPYRWRPMTFEVDGKTYVNERAIATQQTAFWFVGECRNWVPREVGGILWFGVDDAATSCLAPVYSSCTEVSPHWAVGNGDLLTYSPTSMFWLFNRVAQFAYLRYNVVGKEVRSAADDYEKHCIAQIPEIDKHMMELLKTDPGQAQEYINTTCLDFAGQLFDRWCELDKYLLVRYIDGNVKLRENGAFVTNGISSAIPASPDQPGYTDKWKRAVAADAGKTLEVVEPVK